MLCNYSIHSRIDSKVREAITQFAIKSGVRLPANGDDDTTAWALYDHFRSYHNTSSVTLDIDSRNDFYLELDSSSELCKTARYNIYVQAEAEICGISQTIYAQIGRFGSTPDTKWRSEEYHAAVTDMIMQGNENTPTSWDLFVNTDAVNAWVLKHEAVNAWVSEQEKASE